MVGPFIPGGVSLGVSAQGVSVRRGGVCLGGWGVHLPLWTDRHL